ncbi:MAG: SUMF1/EgtB/PvdO family nonheme iron enzyme [Bacteroidota bacterium]
MNRLFLLMAMLLFSLTIMAQDSLRSISQRIPGTDIEINMVYVPAGSFQIGSEAGIEEDEAPRRTVAVDSFWMGQFEIRFDEYEIYRDRELDNDSSDAETAFVADAVSRPSPPYEDPTFGMGKYGYPASSMTQLAALQFCRWLSNKTGRFFRLPTEAEWEYACRAGSETPYFFGEDDAELDAYAWHEGNSEDAFQKVGQKKPNPWGLYDMLGNVAEWTLDEYQADYYATQLGDSINASPWRKPKRLHPRTVKGGSYQDAAAEMRSANRIRSSMQWKHRDPQIPKSFWWNTDSPFVGFRVISPAKNMSAADMKAFWKLVLGG